MTHSCTGPAFPLVTVIAVCFNHERFLIECLESIRRQIYPHRQLIILDDSSTDNSVAVIRNWISSTNADCLFIPHQRNQGICRTLNEALTLATGAYVSIISTDDVWFPDKLADQVLRMSFLPSRVGVLYTDAWRVDEIGSVIPGMFIDSYRQFATMPEGNILNELLDGNFIPAMTTLIRRSCFDTVGFFDERLCYEDWDMWLRIAEQYEFAFSPHIAAKYRVLPTSLVRSASDARRADWLASDFLIRLKLLRLLRDDPGRYDSFRAILSRHAEELYRLNHPQRACYIWRAMAIESEGAPRRRRRTFFMWLCASLGLPRRGFDTIDSWVAALRARLDI